MGKEFEDMLAGIDHLIENGLVNADQVGIGGGSYGGYTSAWAATKHSERFKAAVVFAGIANQISKAGVTDTPVENATVHWNVWLYDNMDLVWDRSPIKHIRNAQTPTLIRLGLVRDHLVVGLGTLLVSRRLLALLGCRSRGGLGTGAGGNRQADGQGCERVADS